MNVCLPDLLVGWWLTCNYSFRISFLGRLELVAYVGRFWPFYFVCSLLEPESQPNSRWRQRCTESDGSQGPLGLLFIVAHKYSNLVFTRSNTGNQKFENYKKTLTILTCLSVIHFYVSAVSQNEENEHITITKREHLFFGFSSRCILLSHSKSVLKSDHFNK